MAHNVNELAVPYSHMGKFVRGKQHYFLMCITLEIHESLVACETEYSQEIHEHNEIVAVGLIHVASGVRS